MLQPHVEHLALRQQNRVNVTFEMVDGDERLAQGEGQRFGVGNPHQQCARQAWALGHGDGIQIGEADAGFVQRRANHRNDVAQMFARGEFRNHAAIGRMDGDLRGHNAREDAPPALHHRGRGLVAGAFDGENQPAGRGEAPSAQKQLAGLTHVSIVVDMAVSAASGAEDAAAQIVARLRAAGHQAYFVGGCVRDLLLGREPEDFDVATSAPPDQVLTLFEKTFAVGAHFGVVLVCSKGLAMRRS